MIAAWSIKKRIIFTVISLCLASIAILGVFAYERQKHQMQEGLKDQALKDGRLFEAILRGDAEWLARAHAGLDRLDSLLAPFAAGNKNALLAAAQPIFNEIRQGNNITHMYFIQPDGKVLLRVHKPEQEGDILKRETFLKAQSTKKTASGLEMGKNFFSLRSVRPVSYQGRAIGYIEVAEEIDHVFQQMKQITGNEVSVFLTDSFLKSKNTELQSEQVGSFRILYPTQKEVALGLAAQVASEMQDGLKEARLKIVSYKGGEVPGGHWAGKGRLRGDGGRALLAQGDHLAVRLHVARGSRPDRDLHPDHPCRRVAALPFPQEKPRPFSYA